MSSSDQASQSPSVRPGALALAVAGVLLAAFPFIRPFYSEPIGTSTEVARAAAVLSSPAWVLSHLVAAGGVMLLPLGVFALYMAVVRERVAALAMTAVVLAAIGSGMLLVVIGGEIFGLSAVTQAYQAGESPDLVAALNRVRNPTLFVTLLVGLAIWAAGGIVSATVIWRSRFLPRWAGVLLAIGLTLWMPLLPQVPRTVDGLVLGLGACWLARELWRLQDPQSAALRDLGWQPSRGAI